MLSDGRIPEYPYGAILPPVSGAHGRSDGCVRRIVPETTNNTDTKSDRSTGVETPVRFETRGGEGLPRQCAQTGRSGEQFYYQGLRSRCYAQNVPQKGRPLSTLSFCGVDDKASRLSSNSARLTRSDGPRRSQSLSGVRNDGVRTHPVKVGPSSGPCRDRCGSESQTRMNAYAPQTTHHGRYDGPTSGRRRASVVVSNARNARTSYTPQRFTHVQEHTQAC